MVASTASKMLILTNLPDSASPLDIVSLLRDKSKIELAPGDLKIIPNKQRGGYTAIVKVPETEAERVTDEIRGADLRGNNIRARIDKPRVKPSASITAAPVATPITQTPPNSTILIPPSPAGTAPGPIVTPPGANVIIPGASPSTIAPVATAAGVVAGTVQGAQQPTVVIPPTPAVPTTVVPAGTPTVPNRQQQQNAASKDDLKIVLEKPRDPDPDEKFVIGIQTFRGGKGVKARFKISANTPAKFYDGAGQDVTNEKMHDTGKDGHGFISVVITNRDVHFATVHLDFEGGTRHDVNLSR